MQPRGRAGQQNSEESTQWPFFIFFERDGGGTTRKDMKIIKVLPGFIVAGCGRRQCEEGEVYRERETTGGH